MIASYRSPSLLETLPENGGNLGAQVRRFRGLSDSLTLGFMLCFLAVTFLVGDKKKLKMRKGLNPHKFGTILYMSGMALIIFSSV